MIQIHGKGQQRGEHPEYLDIGGEQLVEQEIEVGHEADSAVLGIGQDLLVLGHALEQADVPPPPLAEQVPQALGHLDQHTASLT